jgi:COMPASS component SPP1
LLININKALYYEDILTFNIIFSRHLKKFGPSIRLKLRCDQRTCRVLGDPLKPSKSINRNTKLNRKRRRDSSNERIDYLEPPRHCYGPSCTKQSRPGSKYCSEDCGIKLATNRIFQVLPQRLQEWSFTPCIAEQNNRLALENVRKQQHEVRRILQELDKRHAELDKIVERARHAVIDPKAEIDDNDDTEMSMYCITCGHEINSRTAIKHMEKCFNKVSLLALLAKSYNKHKKSKNKISKNISNYFKLFNSVV